MRPTKHYYSSSAAEEKETVTANTITTTMMDNNNYESLEEAAVSSTSSQSRRLNGIEEKEEEKQCHNLEGDTIEINQRKKRRGLRGTILRLLFVDLVVLIVIPISWIYVLDSIYKLSSPHADHDEDRTYYYYFDDGISSLLFIFRFDNQTNSDDGSFNLGTAAS